MNNNLHRIIATPKISNKIILKWLSADNKPLNEDGIAYQVRCNLAQYTMQKRLKAVWFHVPNEAKRSKQLGMIMKALGMIPGVSDYVFLWDGGCGVIELKHGNNGLRDSQAIFLDWCRDHKVNRAVCYGANQVDTVLREWGILKEKPGYAEGYNFQPSVQPRGEMV